MKAAKFLGQYLRRNTVTIFNSDRVAYVQQLLHYGDGMQNAEFNMEVTDELVVHITITAPLSLFCISNFCWENFALL